MPLDYITGSDCRLWQKQTMMWNKCTVHLNILTKNAFWFQWQLFYGFIKEIERKIDNVDF